MIYFDLRGYNMLVFSAPSAALRDKRFSPCLHELYEKCFFFFYLSLQLGATNALLRASVISVKALLIGSAR